MSVEKTPETIGTAEQLSDGTIVLTLRAEDGIGGAGDGEFHYPPTDKDYDMVARHVGPIPKGGSVLVGPFPK